MLARAKNKTMGEAENKKSKAIYGVGFLLSLVATAALLMFMPGLFWTALPFVFTFGVRFMDII
ncbi:MAG: hypothetical protein D4R43_04220 [Sphingobacteriales bacterium]|nr:MAG: hypothetical protein D4R43_04220 [Sphingobacteriales bacterium]